MREHQSGVDGLGQRSGQKLHELRAAMANGLAGRSMGHLNRLNDSARSLLMVLRSEVADCVQYEQPPELRDLPFVHPVSERHALEAAIAEVIEIKAHIGRARSDLLSSVHPDGNVDLRDRLGTGPLFPR